MADGTPGGGGNLERGVPTDSARSRSGGMDTFGTGQAAGAGPLTTARGGRGRETRDGV